MHNYSSSLVVATLLSVVGSVGAIASEQPILLTDNAALIARIHANRLFAGALGKCVDETLVRGMQRELHTFSYKATCAIDPKPQTGCDRYAVSVDGTLDAQRWSNHVELHRITLTLQCN